MPEHGRYIDDCRHTFEHLTTAVLPGYMAQLRTGMSPEARMPAKLFSEPRRGPVALARELGLESDFSGCYVLLEGDRPFYVGISRSVLARLRQHLTGKTHFDASLAYAMARREHRGAGQPSKLMKQPSFQEGFLKARKKLRDSSVAFVPIENPLELYLFEAYAAMELRTSEWNTFRTH